MGLLEYTYTHIYVCTKNANHTDPFWIVNDWYQNIIIYISLIFQTLRPVQEIDAPWYRQPNLELALETPFFNFL